MTYFVYIVRCSDNTLYTGSTNNLEKRVITHNTAAVGAKYTRARRPVKLVYAERARDVSSALKREYEVKQLTRKKKLELVLSSKENAQITHSL